VCSSTYKLCNTKKSFYKAQEAVLYYTIKIQPHEVNPGYQVNLSTKKLQQKLYFETAIPNETQKIPRL